MGDILDVIKEIVTSDTFGTVFSGIGVFIISQYILELIIKPRTKLREKYAQFSKTLLLYHAQYKNGNLKDEQIENIKIASTDLLSTAWLVFKSRKKRKIFLEISRLINLITSQSMLEKKDYRELIDSVRKIEKLDHNIIITYRGEM